MDFVNQKATLRSGGLRPFHNVTDVAAFLLILLLSGIIAYGSSVEAWLLGIAVFVVLTAVLIGFNLRTDYRYGAVRIIPRKQNEARGLSSETRKQLLIALVSAIIGAVIIGLAGLWAGFFHR